MDYWALLGLLVAIFFTFSNLVSKYIGNNFNLLFSLFFQYLFFSTIGFFIVFFVGDFKFAVTREIIVLLLILGFIGYIGIWSYIKGMQKLPVGIVVAIAYTFVIFNYFVNIYIFPDIESLSIEKLIIGFCLFVVVIFFSMEKDIEDKKIKLNKGVIYPIITIVCWVIYYSINNYIIKNEMLTPIQNAFYSDGMIFIFSILFLIFNPIKDTVESFKSITLKQLFFYFLFASSITGAILSMFYGYKYSSANIIHLLGMFGIIFTSIASYFIYKEKLTRLQIILIFVSFILLSLFAIL